MSLKALLILTVEHNIPTKEEKPEQPSRRPDLSTFFSTLDLVDTSDPQAHHNAHALPQPENVAAAFRLLANAFEMMQGRPQQDTQAGDNPLLAQMIEVLRQNADDPPAEVKGVPNTFLDELERVPKKVLKKDDTCPICVNPFLDGRFGFGLTDGQSLAYMLQIHTRLSSSFPATRITASTWSALPLG